MEQWMDEPVDRWMDRQTELNSQDPPQEPGVKE